MKIHYLQLTPKHWKAYSLLDSGNFEKLEQFGTFLIRRPEPQALWKPILPEKEWNKPHIITFKPTSSYSGIWKEPAQKQWTLSYQTPEYKLQFLLAFTQFKHLGIFPEQAENWDFIFHQVKKIKECKVLNLFAYTGGASLAAAIAHPKAQITHLDAVKSIVQWAKQNAQLNHLQNIRWIIEDATSFVKREIRRGNQYHGLIMDPPAFGHGPNGEQWKLETNLQELLSLTSKLLNPRTFFFVLNTYSLHLSPLVLENLILSTFQNFPIQNLQIGELYLQATTQHKLPTGIFCRFHS